MTTYSVVCPSCGKESLLEKAQPLSDPGTLPAFCSPECSAKFGRAQFQEMADAGMGVIVDVDCGCFAIVHGIEGSGSTMPWLVCPELANWSEHSTQVHREAVEIMRAKLAQPVHKYRTVVEAIYETETTSAFNASWLAIAMANCCQNRDDRISDQRVYPEGRIQCMTVRTVENAPIVDPTPEIDRQFSARHDAAKILETIAADGLPHPRDLDVALDALESLYEVPRLEAGYTKIAAPLRGVLNDLPACDDKELGIKVQVDPANVVDALAQGRFVLLGRAVVERLCKALEKFDL